MTIYNEYRGLCSTCKNSPYCTFPRHPTWPVFQCEEFEGDQIYLKRKPSEVSSPSITPHTWPNSGERVYKKGMELCSNCENCETCTFPKPEGGVWHCEEYK